MGELGFLADFQTRGESYEITKDKWYIIAVSIH